MLYSALEDRKLRLTSHFEMRTLAKASATQNSSPEGLNECLRDTFRGGR